MQKVTSLIDIAAPCEEVFDLIANLERRMQLSPLWGVSRLLGATSNFPESGSSYRIQVMPGTPFGIARGTMNTTHSALSGLSQLLSLKLHQADTAQLNQVELGTSENELAHDRQAAEDHEPVEQEYYISEYQPPHKLSYYLDTDCKTIVTWRFRTIPFGTRVNYEEVFCNENVVDENFLPTVRRVIAEWLANIKRYSELRTGRGRRFVKWFLDRLYLRLRPDQRRVVLMMLVMQAIGLATFIIALIGWGVASLFFGFYPSGS